MARDDLYKQGVAVFNAGQIDDARALFDRVLELDPDHAHSHYMLGMCFVNTGDNAQALEHLEKFLELDPENPDAATAREMVNYLAGS